MGVHEKPVPDETFLGILNSTVIRKLVNILLAHRPRNSYLVESEAFFEGFGNMYPSQLLFSSLLIPPGFGTHPGQAKGTYGMLKALGYSPFRDKCREAGCC